MPDVQFEQEQANFNSRVLDVNRLPKMVKVLVDAGIAKDTAQANVILICSAILIFIISIFILYKTFSRGSVPSSGNGPTQVINMPLGPR